MYAELPVEYSIEALTWYQPDELTLVNDRPPLKKVALNIFTNLPSWKALGITAGLAVLISATVKPDAGDDNKFWDADVAVLVCTKLSSNLQFNAPETLNVNPVAPKPNNCASADEVTVVEPVDTLVKL